MAETRKTFQIRQPQDVRYSGHGSGGMFTARMEWDASLAARLNGNLARSTKVCGSDLHRPYGTGDTVPKWHTAGCSNTWHGHRFRSDRAVHTVRQKAVLRTQKAVQVVRTHEEPAQGQHPEGGG